MKKMIVVLCGIATAYAGDVAATEDIEFVQEHLAEVPMDNRFATLPIWNSADSREANWSLVGQAGYESAKSGNLNVDGPMFSIGASRAVGSTLTVGAFAFLDTLRLHGEDDVRPLQTLFSPNTPFVRPVDARFDHLDGRVGHCGTGIRLTVSADSRWSGFHRWLGGVMWQRVTLRDYRLDYQILSGASSGMRGQIDFDANYAHVTPFAGIEFPRAWTRWSMTPHVLLAVPFPKRGIVGHITGPGFDLRGDTETVGEGKHFGDPSLTIGLEVTYLPAHFTMDVGTLLTQRFIEPFVHPGIETNWVVSLQWRR